MTDEEAKALEAKLTAQRKVTPLSASDFLSSGYTCLNLAATGKLNCCYAKKGTHFLWGDSQSGKTVLALTALAQAKLSPAFKGYRLIYDGPEDGAKMIASMFPILQGAVEIYESETIPEFHAAAEKAMLKGPCVYVEDSLDALYTPRKKDAPEDDVTMDEYLKRAKLFSFHIRKTHAATKRHGSVLILLGQSRDKCGFGAMPGQRTRGGGRAPTFYAQLEGLTTIGEHLRKPYKEHKLEVGIVSRCSVLKNRFNGRPRTVELVIYHDNGPDDVESCIRFLLEWKHWKPRVKTDKKPGAEVVAPEFDYSGDIESLVQKIESENLIRPLRRLVAEVWLEIEDAVTVQRKRTYG